MNIFKKISAISALVVCFGLGLTTQAFAATSPILVGSAPYSVLGGQAVTCTGSSTIVGSVGVSPGTSISGFPSPCTAAGGTHSNDASAIAATADSLAAFGTLDQTCDHSYGAQDLTLLSPLPPGVYCSTSSFTLSGNLTLTGSGVWIFKTVSTLITSPGSSVTGGTACSVWWRIGSSATLATTTSFIGNILMYQDATFDTGASLNGRVLGQAGSTVTLDSNILSYTGCGSIPTIVPSLPNTGIAPKQNGYLWQELVTAGTIALVFSLYFSSKRSSSKF
ncbi:MAG TPA: ice-binding family protein [Candidatus Saccharimonadales bacterium]